MCYECGCDPCCYGVTNGEVQVVYTGSIGPQGEQGEQGPVGPAGGDLGTGYVQDEWTPVFLVGVVSNPTYTSKGWFTKIGSFVWIWGQIDWTSKGTGVGLVSIQNDLPYSPIGFYNFPLNVSGEPVTITSGRVLRAFILNGNNNISLAEYSELSGVAAGTITDADLTSGGRIHFEGFYVTDD